MLVSFLLLGRAAGQDTVYIAGSGGGETKISGRVVDSTGRELRIEHPGGQQQSFSADRVLRIETQYCREQTEADALAAGHDFDAALALYLKAVDSEPRRWVRRLIIAQIVWCYQALDQPERAGEAFLLLIRDDPDTPYFDYIPLAWIPRQPPADLERAARQWMSRPEPAARLLGASHLLAGSDRSAAVEELRRLAAGADPQVAALAMAQTWRAELVTAAAEQLDGWERLIEQMPEGLAAGPYYVLGRARAQHQQLQRAALALLRVAIVYPRQRPLAAEALLDAGRVLEQLGRSAAAGRLYRELIRGYPEQRRPVAEAQGRLEQLGGSRQQAGAGRFDDTPALPSDRPAEGRK